MGKVPDQSDPIIQSKLYRPHNPDALWRDDLVERLAALVDASRVVLVQAPAGYGKSSLAGQWAESAVMPVVWVSVDETDRSPAVLLPYVVAAIARFHPEFGESLTRLLRSPHTVAPRTLADGLLSDLEDIPEPVTLVLDDYDLLDGSTSEEVLQRVMRYLPDQVRLVLLCRARPRLSFLRLQVGGGLGELTADDLRLTGTETTLLLSRMAGRSVDAPTAAQIGATTEGWATAVSLAGISLRSRTDGDMNRLLSGEDRSRLMDYLMADVARQISPEMESFLLHTALLDELSPALCSAVMPVDEAGGPTTPRRARQLLTDIHHANLFLISLDDQGELYRYHHLFGQLLRREGLARLPDAERAAVHRRAAGWYEAEGRIREAIHHALLADDPAEAARIAEAHYHEALNREQWQRLVIWLAILPKAVMDRPGILMMRAWIEHFGWRTQAAADLAARAQAALAAGSSVPSETASRLDVEARVLRAQFEQFIGSDSLDDLRDALAALPSEMVFCRSLAVMYMGIGLQHQGQAEAGVAFLQERLAAGSYQADARTFRLFIGLNAVHFYSGGYRALASTARTFYDLSSRTNHTVSISWATWLLGMVAYERNDLPEAEARFREVVQMRLSGHAKAVVEAFHGLVLALLNQGRLDEAEETLDRYRAYLLETKGFVFLPILDSLVQRLRLARHLAAPGGSNAAPAVTVPPVTPLKLGFMENPQVTAARVLLAQGDPAALRRANDLLLAVRAEALRTNEIRWLVAVNALLAVVRWQLGECDAALDDLRVALAQGEPEGYMRSLLDIGPALAPLLGRLREGGEFVAYCDRLGLALDDPTVVGGAALEALLTNREMEVLERLVLRQSNKEIAGALYLSPLTVKRHTQSLFRKLGASNRREAVVLARQKGLTFDLPGPTLH
jgi:LuxR family maltose regulon positive regulatory protein